MTEDQQLKTGKALDPLTGMLVTKTDKKTERKSAEEIFADDFEKLKLSVIRPTFETVGNKLKEHGHEINISEEPAGKISIHIVPAGTSKSIHPYDWFPTLSYFGASYTKTIGLHGRNARRNSESGNAPRGDYKVAQINTALVEKDLMKFVGEIANW